MDKVFESFEKALIFIKTHEDWFDYSGDRLERAMQLYNRGFLKVMKERDSEGRRILLCNNDLDMRTHNADDVYRLHCMIIMLLAIEEKTQVCGAVYIDDFTGISMKYMMMYPLKSIYDFTLQLKMTPIRLKNICLVGLPLFATQFLNVVKLALSDTMNKRFQVFDEFSQALSVVEQASLTKDYGGKSESSEVIEDFRGVIEERLEVLKAFLDFKIDLEKAEVMKDVHENVGSFRKLEID
jgi:hypothetical protein